MSYVVEYNQPYQISGRPVRVKISLLSSQTVTRPADQYIPYLSDQTDTLLLQSQGVTGKGKLSWNVSDGYIAQFEDRGAQGEVYIVSVHQLEISQLINGQWMVRGTVTGENLLQLR
mgnify:CR=1 FL=1